MMHERRRALSEKNVVAITCEKASCKKKESSISLVHEGDLWIKDSWIFVRCGQKKDQIKAPKWWETGYADSIVALRLCEEHNISTPLIEKIARALLIDTENKLDLSLAVGASLSQAQDLLREIPENLQDICFIVAIDQSQKNFRGQRRSSTKMDKDFYDEDISWLARAGRFETIVMQCRQAGDDELATVQGRRAIIAQLPAESRITVKAKYPIRSSSACLGTATVAWTQDNSELCQVLCPPPTNIPLDAVFVDMDLSTNCMHTGPIATFRFLLAMKDKKPQLIDYTKLWHPQESDGVEALWPNLANAVAKNNFDQVRTSLGHALAAVARGDILPVIRKENQSELAAAARAAIHAATLARYGGKEAQIADAYAQAAKSANRILYHATNEQLTHLVVELGAYRLHADFIFFFGKQTSTLTLDWKKLEADAYTAELRCLATQVGITDYFQSHDATNRLHLNASLPIKTRHALAEPTLWHAANASRSANPRVFVRLTHNDNDVLCVPSRKPSHWMSLLPPTAGNALDRLETVLSCNHHAISAKQASDIAKCLIGTTTRTLRTAVERKRRSSRRLSLQQDTTTDEFPSGVTVLTCTRHDASLDLLLSSPSSLSV